MASSTLSAAVAMTASPIANRLLLTGMRRASRSSAKSLTACQTAIVSRRKLHLSGPNNVIRSPLPDIEVPVMPVTDFVFRNMKSFGDRPALINGLTGQSLTYPQTRDAIWRVASGLIRHGVQPNDVVMVISENKVEYVLTFHAVLSIGATLTMVNPIYPSSDVINQARDSNAKFILVSHQCLTKAIDVKNALPQQIKKVFSYGDESGCVSFSTLLADDGSLYPTETKFDPKTQVAILPYSSGTTGLPKGVMLSHYNEVANTLQTDAPEFFPFREDIIQLGLLPFYHIYAVIATFLTSLALGQTSVIIPGFDPRTFLEIIPKYQINMTYAVPPIIMFLNKHPMAAKADLSSLRRIVSGAAPLGADMVDEFYAKHPHCNVGQGYGMTETSPVIAVNPVKSCPTKPAAAGIPVASTEIKLVDPATGKECEGEEHGEVCVRGPQVMLGYLNNPTATADIIDAEGWLHTGDVGYMDSDNHLFISDRLKELIKYKGLQVPPAELEAVLCSHPSVADAGVIGVPDPDGGEVPRAYVALKSGATVDVKELQKYVNEHVVSYKRLRGGIVFMPEIPRSAAGKILRKQLKEVAKSSTVDTSKFSPAMME